MGLQDLFGYNVAAGTSAETLAARRKMAQQLLEEGGSSAPIQHWLQGADRIAGAIIGGLQFRQLEDAEKTRHADAQKMLSGLLDLGGTEPGTPAPAAPPVSAAAGSRAAAGDSSLGARITAAESGGNMNARAATSSATGPNQFIDSTWLDVLKRNRPDKIAGKTREQILAMRTDPNELALNNEMRDAYSGEISQHLKSQGIAPTPGNVYLGYFLGPGDAAKVLKSNPAEPVAGIVSPASVEANPFLRTMTAGRAQRWAAGKVGEPTGPAAPGDAATEAPAAASASPAGLAAPTNTKRLLRMAVKMTGNPETAALGHQLITKALTEEGKSTDDIREYQLAIQQGYKGSFLEWQTKSKFNKSEGGKQPIPLKGPGGKETVGFYQGNARVEPATFPENYEYSPPVTNVETPTAVIQRTKGGVEIGREAKDISGAASQKAQGEVAGGARSASFAAKTMVDSALTLGAELRTHPGLDTATGASGLFDPRNYIPGTDAADFEKMRGELAAKRFMTAREGLKGAGAVTDFEGEEGGKAIGDLSRAKSKEAFLEALGRVEKMMMASYRDLLKKAALDKVSTQGDAPIEPLAPVQKWERGPDGRPRRVQ